MAKLLGIFKDKRVIISLKLLSIFLALTAGILAHKIGSGIWKNYQELLNTSAENRNHKKELQFFLDKEFSLKVISKTLMVSYDLSKWEAKYYSFIIYDMSKINDVPWQLFPALIRIESNFNPTSSSNKNAKGLTQVLKSTAEELCVKLEIDFKENVTLWNDILNMVIGFTYLSDGIESRTEENIKHGIKRYLGGPDYKKSVKFKDHITGYKTTLWDEYIRLTYISKGVESEIEKEI